MKYAVAIETIQIVETEAETEDAAIEMVQKQLEPRVAAAAVFSIVRETTYNEETNSYSAN